MAAVSQSKYKALGCKCCAANSDPDVASHSMERLMVDDVTLCVHIVQDVTPHTMAAADMD